MREGTSPEVTVLGNGARLEGTVVSASRAVCNRGALAMPNRTLRRVGWSSVMGVSLARGGGGEMIEVWH